MFRKSIIIVFVQIIGSALGLLTIYLIAGSMEPEVYSLTGIYTIMAGITLTFSDLGIETTMMREALYWEKSNDSQNISEFASQAIMSRFMAFLVLIPILTIYALMINKTKYNGECMGLLLIFVFGASINSLNNAMSLIVRSLGGYVFSQISSTANNYILKFVGIGLYFWKGAYAYLLFYGLSSIPLAIVYFVKLHTLIDIKKMHLKPVLKKIVEGKYLWLKTDLDYFKNNADSMLVSTLFPAGILGSYSIYKQLEQLAKSVIEGFFDVLSQNTVRYKGDKCELDRQEDKIKKARNIILIGLLIGTSLFSLNTKYIIDLIHLSKYENIDLMIYCVVIVSICHLIGKYEINAIAFFGTSKMNFSMGIAIFTMSCLSYVVVFLFPSILGVLIQRIIIYVVTSALAIILFKIFKKDLYTKVLK